MERLDNLAIPDRADEIRCFFCGRNEARRLPEFLEYHRRLGVERFFFVDNGSTDESVEIAGDNWAIEAADQDHWELLEAGPISLRCLKKRFV